MCPRSPPEHGTDLVVLVDEEHFRRRERVGRCRDGQHRQDRCAVLAPGQQHVPASVQTVESSLMERPSPLRVLPDARG